MKAVVAIAFAFALVSCSEEKPLVLVPPPPDPVEVQAVTQEWRTLLELELPSQVLEPGLPRVREGGDLTNTGQALALVARALVETGRHEEARGLLTQASLRLVNDAHVTTERARMALWNDELEQAIELLCEPGQAGQSIRHPELAEAWLTYGRALARSDRWDEAAGMLRGFLEQAPRHAEAPAAYHMLIRHALRAGDTQQAQEYERKAARISNWHTYYRARRLQAREHPEDPLPVYGLVLLWLSANDPGQAQQHATDLVTRFPDFCRGWGALGDTHQRLGDFAHALEAWSRALECDSGLGPVRLNRAILAVMQERDDDAYDDLKAIVEGRQKKDPRLRRAHLELARLYLRRNERTAAEASHAHYVELGGKQPLDP